MHRLPVSTTRLAACALLAACPAIGFAVDVPVTTAAAERLLDHAADVTAEFRQLIDRTGAAGRHNVATLADTSAPAWRLYYRDRQLLFAVPSRRNLTAAEKKIGEADAAKLAAGMLQQQFQRYLQLESGTGLEQESVRVVFIEPAALEIAAGGWSGARPGPGGCGQGAGMHGGFAGVPLPFATAGFWPSTGGGSAGGCGCR